MGGNSCLCAQVCHADLAVNDERGDALAAQGGGLLIVDRRAAAWLPAAQATGLRHRKRSHEEHDRAAADADG